MFFVLIYEGLEGMARKLPMCIVWSVGRKNGELGILHQRKPRLHIVVGVHRGSHYGLLELTGSENMIGIDIDIGSRNLPRIKYKSPPGVFMSKGPSHSTSRVPAQSSFEFDHAL